MQAVPGGYELDAFFFDSDARVGMSILGEVAMLYFE